MGRMLEPAALLAEVAGFFAPKRLAGKRVLVTAGPTEEPLDPVRVITNASSGKTPAPARWASPSRAPRRRRAPT
jgi:phosphopantothenoylcysteine decarboxylase / phosphopantothenate---cysteine ligase